MPQQIGVVHEVTCDVTALKSRILQFNRHYDRLLARFLPYTTIIAGADSYTQDDRKSRSYRMSTLYTVAKTVQSQQGTSTIASDQTAFCTAAESHRRMQCCWPRCQLQQCQQHWAILLSTSQKQMLLMSHSST
ncbi:TPA: hypothetical protein ACH3X1_016746 [Trebouxia sp. C0004]